jgi:hypothetical protein
VRRARTKRQREGLKGIRESGIIRVGENAGQRPAARVSSVHTHKKAPGRIAYHMGLSSRSVLFRLLLAGRRTDEVPPFGRGLILRLNSHTAHKVRRFVCCHFGAVPRWQRGGVIPLIHRQFGVSYSIQIQEGARLKVAKAGRAPMSRCPEPQGAPRACMRTRGDPKE